MCTTHSDNVVATGGGWRRPAAIAAPPPAISLFGFAATPESPYSPSGTSVRPRSLLSDALLREGPPHAPRGADASPFAAAATAAAAAAAAVADDVTGADEDDDDECDLDEEELSLLEELDAGWSSSPGSSIFSRGSSSRPITIPAASYFKTDSQRSQWERLNRKRAWLSRQQEQERLMAKTGGRAVAQQVPRPPPKQHKQHALQ